MNNTVNRALIEAMKKLNFKSIILTITLLLTLGVGQMWGGAGFWGDDAVVLKYWLGGDDVEYKHKSSLSTTKDLGTVTSFYLKHWEFRTWKDGSGNICDNGTMYYRIYLTSASAPSWSSWSQDGTSWSGNNQYHYKDCNNNILSGLVGGVYYFEYKFKTTGNTSSSSGCGTNIESSAYKIKFKYDPKYTVTVSAGSNGSVASTSVTAGNIDAVTLPTATANTGYHFVNWTTASSNLTLGSTTSATGGTVKARAAATVTANFAANTYTVAYNANDAQYPGTATGSTANSSHTYGTAKALTSNGFSRTGYIFAGWATSPTGDVEYTNGQSVTNLSSTQGATVTLYAKWIAITLTATISPSAINANTATSIRFTITTNAPLSSGYFFEITNWGGKNSGTEGGYNIDGDHQITSASPFTYDLAAAKTNLDAGTYKIKIKITKDAVQQVESDLITLTVSSSTYSVTVAASPAGYGTVSPTSISAPADSWSSDITATPNTGYQFDSWTSSGGGITIKDNTANPTQIKATSTGGTLTANFSAATYRVTLDNQSATSAGTAYVDATYKSTTLSTITKPTKTNYTFGGYYTAVDGGGTQIIDADGNWLASKSGYTDESKKSLVTEDKTLYAKWTETKYAVTVAVDNASHAAGNIDCSAAGWVACTSGTAQIGNVTNVTITVPAGATGYTYTGGSWVLTGGVTLVSGSLSSPSITVKATSAGSATFTYAEDLSSPWIVAGGNKIVTTGTTWRTTADANNSMVKKTGHSTESVVYFTVPVTTVCSGDPNTNFQFKIYNTSTSKWYGLFASGSYYLLKAEDGTEKSLVEGNKNIELRAYVTGDYEFKLDYSTSTPKLTVTWPVINQVRISAASPTDATNVGNFDLSDPVSNVRSVKRSLNANTTYTFKIVYNSDFYGYNSGTFTRSTSTSSNSRTISTSGGDMTLTTDYAGDYTFKFNQSTKALSVDFPTAYKITFGKGSVNGTTGSFSAVNLDNGNSAVTSNSTWVKSGNRVKITAPSAKAGYKFKGWYNNNTATGDAITTNANCTITVSSNQTVYACYVAKQSTLTFNYQSSAEGWGSNGSVSVASPATYDAAMPTLSGTMPTAANGYAFMGFYDGTGGSGTKYYNADGSSAHNWDKDTESGTTLYAYYKKAEITDLTLSSAIVAPSTNFTVTPTLDPASGVQGIIVVCYKVQYSNGTDLPVQPAMSQVGNVVTITAPTASATYRIEAKLRLNDCDGTVLDTRVTTFQVAGEHTVTVRYQDSDGRTIKASTEVTARPLTWTTDGDITPPTITGYTFVRWDAGDGVSIKNGDSDPVTTTTTSSIQIKAVYDGTLTAVYNKKNVIYFYNTVGWTDVWVYFYTSDKYWADDYGTGAYKGKVFEYNKQFWDMHYGQMTQIEGTNIWYFDYTAKGWDGWPNIAFANMNKANSGEDNTSDNDKAFFSNTTSNPIQVIRRGDHKTTLPMFVPLTGQTKQKKNNNKAEYLSDGYWMNYPENTGYTLKIYNAWNVDNATGAAREIPFPYSEDKTMPLKMDVELSDGYNHDYWFMVYRNDGVYLGGGYHFKQGYQAEQVITRGNSKEKITTSAPGNYTFTLTYHDNGSGTVNYYIDVDFPIATGDYRIYYSDNATWSKAAHTKDSWYHPSHSIGKATTEAKKDTISFYIPKGEGILHTMKFQKASVTNEGIVSWSDVDGGSITIPSSVTTTGVYNFIVSQPAGGASISLEKVEPYTGNFYIRTDCAGNTKWDSFKNLDHQMTYSDYAANNSGFSHYFAHWVTGGNNVKFCIANDYSMCISDTLTQDYGTVVANIDANGFLASGSAHNANIRFMWNQETNKISRAYISGSSNISDRFLVLEGDAKMYDKDGNALSITGLNANEINLVDDQNFVYEQTIQVNTSARAKLTAKYNNNIQYFRGSAGAFAEGTTVELLGGSASGKHKMRIVYDFKTDRLVTAYLPSGTIDEDMEINADLMIVREHQEDGQQITFNGGSLSEVHTVYGVMRFNRWTLNNKEKTGEHDPVGDPKSAYERAIYWISFPFDVNLSDVFGFGTYGVDWIIEYYDGEGRAAKGYWADSPTFWKYVTNRNNFVLEAGKGYVLALDLDRMKDNDETFWVNNIEQIELFFPSASNTVGNIEATNVTTTVDSHACTIDRTGNNGEDINKNRTKADSHWNMIGVPSYANYGTTLTSDGSTTITWNSTPSATNSLPFLYEYNLVDNTYTVQSGTTYPFKAMHAYMVQYHGNIYWSMASATPVSPIVARCTYAETPKEVEFRLELQQNDKMVDQTFVKMSNDEEVSANFVFDEDLCKEYNGSKANVYTFIENWIPAAGNTLPMSEQTTVVPVGVKTVAAGDYTFSIPDGTSGIGVTLIDNETGVRTNLSALVYTVNLAAGTYENRFYLEISPIQQTPTGVEEVTGDGLPVTGARKVLIDNKLYIIKGDKVYDARGAKVQ